MEKGQGGGEIDFRQFTAFLFRQLVVFAGGLARPAANAGGDVQKHRRMPFPVAERPERFAGLGVSPHHGQAVSSVDDEAIAVNSFRDRQQRIEVRERFRVAAVVGQDFDAAIERVAQELFHRYGLGPRLVGEFTEALN